MHSVEAAVETRTTGNWVREAGSGAEK